MSTYTTKQENIAQTAERLANDAEPVRAVTGDDMVVAIPPGWTMHDLEKYLNEPRRIQRTVKMATVTGFAEYVKAHALDKQTAIYINERAADAVIDDIVPGANEPAWGDHTARLELELTEEWKAWTSMSGHLQGQREFVNFVQDRAGDITEPDLADLVQQLQAINAESTGSRRDSTGHLSAEQKREQATRITNELPEYLVLLLPVLKCEPDQYTSARARLQVKLTDNGVQFVATLVNAPIVLDSRIREFAGRLREAVGKKAAVYF